MNIWDVIHLVLVALALIAALRAAVRNRKSCCGNCCGCEKCGGSCPSCHSEKKEEHHEETP